MSISGIGKSLETSLFGSKKRVINTILTTVILFAVPITLQLTFQRQDVRQRADVIDPLNMCQGHGGYSGATFVGSACGGYQTPPSNYVACGKTNTQIYQCSDGTYDAYICSSSTCTSACSSPPWCAPPAAPPSCPTTKPTVWFTSCSNTMVTCTWSDDPNKATSSDPWNPDINLLDAAGNPIQAVCRGAWHTTTGSCQYNQAARTLTFTAAQPGKNYNCLVGVFGQSSSCTQLVGQSTATCAIAGPTCSTANCPAPNTCVNNTCTAPTYTCSAANCAAPSTCVNNVCTAPTTPTCNGTIVCSGQCTAPANTCSNNNGTKSNCKYTTYNGSSNCTPANAADQQCTASNCTSPNVCTNGACVTPTPTNTPTPTSSPTPAAGTANIAISVTLPGIGTESYNNNAPRAARAVTVGLYQAGGNQKMKDATGNLSYQNGKYTGTVSVTNITPGSYYVKVRLDNTQYKKNAASAIAAGANSITFSANLVSGDIFSTNSLGLQEYNALVNCYNGGECSADTRTKADLNDDGSVDAKDINIVLVEFARGYTTGD